MFSEVESPFLAGAMAIAALLFLLAAIPILYRIVRGPTVFDRIVALDLFAGVCIGLIVLLAISFGKPVFLEVALIIALVGFLGTVSLARYLERGGDQ